MTQAHRADHRTLSARWQVLLGGALCVCMALLAACGRASTAAPGMQTGQSTATVMTKVTIATATTTATLKVPEGVTDCGAVSQSAAGASPANALNIDACFYTAFQSCHPAALLYSDFGVDTQEYSLFIVQPSANGACGVVRTVKDMGCCGSTSHLIQITDSCSGVVKQSNAYVVLSCGNEGNITLPS